MTQTIEQNSIRDQVIGACNELYTKGQKVSVRLVLSILPNVSSTSTVHKYYKQWRDELEANQQSLHEKMGFSDEFTRAFMREIARHATDDERHL